MNGRFHSNTYELRNLENEPFSKSYNMEDTSYDEQKTSPRRRKSWRTRLSGWRGGVAMSIAVSSLVLLLNIILAIIAATKWDPIEGIATSYTGDCTVAARWTTAVHLVINILSSLLLGASNYCMQRLVAPTRKEVDNAHAQRKWLDIGIPSVRNLRLIDKHRMLPWFMLFLSSVPLHFLYNSVIFQTIGANQVYFLIVDQKFFTDKNNWSYANYNSTWDNDFTRLQNTLLDDKYLDRTLFENITDAECRSRYTAPFISSGAGFGVPEQGEWRKLFGMREDNSLRTYFNGSEKLGIAGYGGKLKFSYCLSQRSPPPTCNIQFSQSILHIVIACNILKIGLMIFILWRLNQETIVTIGDAIKSFLHRPDSTTVNRCLMSTRTIDRLWKTQEQFGQPFKQTEREHWFVACSKRRWVISLLLYFGAIITTGVLMNIIHSHSDEPPRLDKFGKVNTDHLIDIYLPSGDRSVIPYILLANLPQAIISFIYLVYNGQFTAMLANREWSNFAVKRAPLRVTYPSPGQRSTYFLQLPYRFSVPLLLAIAILHWFVSQSIFLVRIAIYKDGKLTGGLDLNSYNQITKQRQHGVFSAVGYSYSALIASISWGSALVAAFLAVAFFGKFPIGLPIGGTNSAVISAACHVKHEEESGDVGGETMCNRPLQWGVTIPGGKDIVGHCSFSSREVDLPEVGHLYAGCTATIVS
jgi:hypothetical protein